MNPARPDEPVGEYPLGDGSTVADAVGAATAALGDWAKTSFGTRAKLMEQTAVLIESQIEELATLCTLEEGKTRRSPWPTTPSSVCRLPSSPTTCSESTGPCTSSRQV